LSTVRGIVTSHGGLLTVYSEPGRGTSFNVYLPVITDTLALQPVGETVPPWGGQELILIVDDEPDIRRALGLTLESQNYRVLLAADGHEAMSLFLVNRENIRLVLTDLMMPGISGVSLIRSLRALEPRLRIVAATGLQDDKRRAELEQLGVTTLLAKPCSQHDILKAVQRALAVKT
jgi:CheY-like chemotaxis protein